MARTCTLGTHSRPPNPVLSPPKPPEIGASRAQQHGLCGWDVEFKSPLAHKEACRSEGCGRHRGKSREHWGYAREPSRNTGEHSTSAPGAHKEAATPLVAEWRRPTGLEST